MGLERWVSCQEVLSSVPRTHMGQLTTACNSGSRALTPFGFCSPLHTHVHTCTPVHMAVITLEQVFVVYSLEKKT